MIQIQSYEDAPYLVLATQNGLVKKSKLTDFDSNRSGGIVAVNLRDNDELVGAVLCSSEDDLLLVSANGQSIRFSATDEALRPMGRATSGVQGMRFNADDRLLSLNVVREGTYLLVATAGGYAKRTGIEEYTVQGRGGKGEGRPDRFSGQPRVGRQDVIDRFARSELFENQLDRDTRTSNDRLAHHDARVGNNESVVVGFHGIHPE